jgi:NitT/TauT family transport system ATP-binding protein
MSPLSSAGASRRTIISVKDVTKRFATREGGQLPVLEGINLEVKPGEIVALLGKSGSGKSTLLRCIAGLVQPSSGQILYRGQPLRGVNPGVSLVFQTFALLPWLTVQQNVELGLEAKGVDPETRTHLAREAIDLIGLDGFESAFPKELSGGMRQRVGFARALVVEPDLLLMDEPFSALDVLTAENLRTEILELWEAGEFPAEAILIVTHNIEEAVTFADRIIVLGTNPGRITRELSCGLQRPRDRKDPAFEALVDEIYRLMTERPPATVEFEAVGAGAPSDDGDHDAGDAAGVEGSDGDRYPMIPHASVDGIAGLAELAGEADPDAELSDLAAIVGFEIDDLFPLIDALALLAFASVTGGRLELTDPGREFAGADIQRSKEIFRAAALERVPLVRRIHRALQHAADGALREGFFMDLLNRHFSPEEARAQLDTAIDWGRYAELFEYDAARGEIMLPEAAEAAA